MIKYFCDKCKEEKEHNLLNRIRDWNIVTDYYLCDRCYKDIINALNNNIKFCSCPVDSIDPNREEIKIIK